MLIDALTDEERALLAGICRARDFRAGEDIVAEGAPGDSFLIIRKGKAEARKRVAGRTVGRLGDIQPGEFVGEMSFMTKAARSASIVAMEDCEVLEFVKSDFDALADAHPELGMKIYKGIAEGMASRLAKSNEDLKNAVLYAMGSTV